MNTKNKTRSQNWVASFTNKVPDSVIKKLFTPEDILFIESEIMADLNFYIQCDPAARNSHSLVKNTYAGFKAVAAYRIANHIAQKAVRDKNAKYLEYARDISEQTKVLTGIEIHPSATIKSPFMIDHGYGVVIGETTEIGKGCCLLNGVVLGAMGIVGNPNSKRHPTLGDNVQVGAFVEVLGNIKIGSNTIIGPRIKITTSIPDNSVLIRKSEYLIIKNSGLNIFTL